MLFVSTASLNKKSIIYIKEFLYCINEALHRYVNIHANILDIYRIIINNIITET